MDPFHSHKRFRLDGATIYQLVESSEACIVSERVSVDGTRVGYMYREAPDFVGDSGWRFFAGDESPAYASNAGHFDLFDLNTLANYDPAVIARLGAPAGSAFARDDAGRLVPSEAPPHVQALALRQTPLRKAG